jgi:outer membrane autotransporter protein
MRPNLANCPLERLPTPGSFWAVALLAIASGALPWNARANLVSSGTSITVDSNAPNPWTSTIGSGPSTASGTTVTLLPNAQVVVGNANAISLADNTNITISGGALVQNGSVNAHGLYNTAGDTIEIRNNSTVTINAGGQVLSSGSDPSGEAINPEGSGNTINNFGTIRSSTAAAIWFQNVNGGNTVINQPSGVIQAPGNVMGASGNGTVDFTNQGMVIGNVIFAGGNDVLHLYTGSTITGSINGGGGNNLMTLNGTGSGSRSGALTNFQTLIKQDSGTWTLSGSIGNNGGGTPLAVEVQNGTLVLSGSNTNFNGTMLVDPQGVLQAPSQSLPPAITDNGQVQFTQTTAGTYTGLISGTGSVVKLDSGTLTLLPSTPGGNTYSGGTFLNAGVLAVGADNALGAPTGGLTFSGGTLQLTNSFNLAATRQITLNAPGGTIDTNGNNTTISQGITGAGQLAKLGAGILTLTGTSSYSGGTTIAAGTLQLGNGGTSGSIVGNVADNGTLVFNRSDALTLDGVISGTGTANQTGTGTTILTGDNTYTGGTTISAGTLQLGNGGTSGSIVGNVTDNGTFVFNRSDTVSFASLISGTGAVNQAGTGTTILIGDNTYTGGTTISAGTLQLGNGGTSGSIVGNVSDNGTLAFNRTDTVTFSGSISGTGAVSQAGTGTVILTGDNSYIGGTTISAGTLQLGNGGTSGSIVGNVADNGTFVFNRSDMLTLNGVISGTGTVNQIGAGTTILTGNNSYSGGTSVTNGTLEANSATALGTGAVVVNGQSSILNTAGTQITNSGTPNQNAASVLNGGTLSMQGGSIRAVAGNALVVGGSSGGPNTVQISGASISSPGSAILAQGTVDTNIVLSNGTTVNAGNGLIFEGKSSATTSLTANASVLSGNIQVTNGTANVTLTNSKLSGWVNQNTLTGASGVSPNDPAGAFANLPPANVNLSVDPSTWTIQASSTLNSLTLGPGSQVIFTPPSSPTGPFKTLVVNNLSGAGTFAMNTDIPALKGDLLVINKTSQGNYLVSINNQPQGIDGPANKGLLVVQTADGQATFQGQTEAGTFRERLVRGNGTAVTPDPKSWYLVREDQPVSNPSASSQPPLVPVSRSNALTNTANAAIATYSAAVPLYYTDMQTLVQRLGELRLSIQAPVTESAEQPPSGKGVVESKQVTPPPVPPTDEWGAWVRGFGSGTRIDNSGSRTFDQNAGGFQIGADKRVSSLWSGDLYLGIFGGYVYASRDFRDGGEGSANEMSLGAYTTWIHPNGWYADLVVKYSQMWNYFRTPNLNGSISTADYDVPALGGSLEVGKRFDLGRGLFFIEPQAQLAAVWIDGGSYGVSNGLRVSGDNQTSLQGRLGGRAGMHIDLSQQRAFELYLKAEAIQEFLTGNTVTTNSTPSDSNLSGTVGRFGGGVTAKVSRSTYLYAEYDYATGDHFQQPWFVNVGLRWQW